MNTFPQYSPAAGLPANYQQQSQMSNFPQTPTTSGGPGQPIGLVTPPDVAMLAHQGYLAQQQQLAAMNQGRQPNSFASSAGAGNGVSGISMQQHQLQQQAQNQAQLVQRAQQQQQQLQQFQQAQQAHLQAQQQQQQPAVPVKKKRGRPSAASQSLARQAQNLQPPRTTDQYVKNALIPPQIPSHAQPSSQVQPHTAPRPHSQANIPHPTATGSGAGAGGVSGADIEPWADGLDDLDPRELAMNRFRARHEILSEVFGPESIKDIPSAPYDPWAGLGIDGETLEAKVAALEAENIELETQVESAVDAFRSRLQNIEAGTAVTA